MKLRNLKSKKQLMKEINNEIKFSNMNKGTRFKEITINEISNPRKYFDNITTTIYISKETGDKFLTKPEHYSKDKFRTVKSADQRVKFIQRQMVNEMKKMNLPKYINSLSFNKDGRSFFTNGRTHKHNDKFIIMDIEKFFDKCTSRYVSRMCNRRGNEGLNVPNDIANFIANFVTAKTNGKERVLIQGFPTSPIMAFYAYKEMFDEIFEYSKKNKVIFTCYVDDLAFSYSNDNLLNSEEFKLEINKIVKKYGHSINNIKTCEGNIATITGIYVKKEVAQASQKIHKKFDKYYKYCISNPVENSYDLYKLWNDYNKFIGLYHTIRYIEAKKFNTDWAKKYDKVKDKYKPIFPNDISPNEKKLDEYFIQQKLFKVFKENPRLFKDEVKKVMSQKLPS